MVKRYLVNNRACDAIPRADRLGGNRRRATYGLVRNLPSILLLLVVAVGCGPGGPTTYPVSGTVTFDGEAMPDGFIMFTGTDSTIPPTTGKIADGKYSLNATADTHRVEIQASRLVGPENPIMGLRAKAQYVPDRYNIESTLSAKVDAAGENRFPFELTSTSEAAP